MRKQHATGIRKADDEQQIVWAEVYAPDYPDSQGDFMSAETIRDMAYGFMQKQELDAVDTNHTKDKNGSYIVESFIARAGDDTFIPGSWVVAVHIPDAEVWGLVKSGELNGFSLDGVGHKVNTVLQFDIPEELTGMTDVAEDGHSHAFIVKVGDDGSFLGGRTDAAPDGHYHIIKRGTCTEDALKHSHRFSYVEGILNAQG